MRASLFLLVLLPLPALAQSWCAPGATWTYEAGMFLAGFHRMSYTHDTIIGLDTAQVIDRYSAIQYPLPPPDYGYTAPYISYTPVAAVTRTDSAVVYLFSGTDQDTLYWFGAIPGDHWYPAFVNDSTCQPLVVTDTSTTVIDGMPLRTLQVSGYTIMERIGCTWDMFMYCPNWIIDGPMGMRCYQDAQINFQPVSYACDQLAGIPDAQRTPLIIYPNPGTDHFTLELPPGPHFITVFDAQGRVVLRQQGNETRPVIHAESLPSGPYRTTVELGQGERRNAAWVKME